MSSRIYVPKHVYESLIQKYPAQSKEIKDKINYYGEKFNKDPEYAQKFNYSVFIDSIKEAVTFKDEQQNTYENFIDKSKINQDIIDILEDRDIFNRITEREMDKKIVREVPARKAIFICAHGRLVKNSQVASYNLLINDEAGTGKDYVTSNALKFLPEEQYIKKTRISPTVFTYWHNSKFEPNWTWDGKVFYTEDISEAVLNSEVFKVMCSSGSEATIVKNQVAIDITIQGKPVIITTTANSNPSPELVRRFEIVNLSEDINQTQEIMKRHCEYAKKGISPEYDKKVKLALSQLKRVNVKIPFADNLYLLFPPNSIMMRTKFPRFLDFIKASAALHQYQRYWENSETILAEKKDYDIACEVMKAVTSNKYLVSLTKKQRKIVDIIENKTKENENYVGSPSEIRKEANNFISLPAMITNLSQLASYGILKIKLEEDSRGREVEKYYLSENILNGVHTIIFPSFEDIIKENSDKANKGNKADKENKLN